MDPVEKLQQIGAAMKLEADEDISSSALSIDPGGGNRHSGKVMPCGQVRTSNAQAKRDALGITQAMMPGGK